MIFEENLCWYFLVNDQLEYKKASILNSNIMNNISFLDLYFAQDLLVNQIKEKIIYYRYVGPF